MHDKLLFVEQDLIVFLRALNNMVKCENLELLGQFIVSQNFVWILDPVCSYICSSSYKCIGISVGDDKTKG